MTTFTQDIYNNYSIIGDLSNAQTIGITVDSLEDCLTDCNLNYCSYNETTQTCRGSDIFTDISSLGSSYSYDASNILLRSQTFLDFSNNCNPNKITGNYAPYNTANLS